MQNATLEKQVFPMIASFLPDMRRDFEEFAADLANETEQ